MLNAAQQALWKGALKSGVSSATGVILANSIDTQQPIFSLAWFKHIGIVIFFTTLTSEARFWNQWANAEAHPYSSSYTGPNIPPASGDGKSADTPGR